MGMIRTIDRRREAREEVDLELLVWGVDTSGERFAEQARAREISLSGALVSGLKTELRSGDVIGLLYAGRKARYRVIWVRYGGTTHRVQAAVQRIEPDPCPWQHLLSNEASAQAAGANSAEI